QRGPDRARIREDRRSPPRARGRHRADRRLTAARPEREVREQALPGAVPRFELDEWRERYGLVAGITGRGDGPGRGFDLGLWTEAPVGSVMSRWREFRAAEPGFNAVVL